MQTEQIIMAREEALTLYREYRRSRQYETKIDAEVKRTYRAIAQGKVVIRALESVVSAGLKPDTFPKLALTRADAPCCTVTMATDGGAVFHGAEPNRRWGGYSRIDKQASSEIRLRAGAFPTRAWEWEWESGKMKALAVVPQAPLHLRPKQADMRKYHILWEAEWSPTPPRDPMLLRRIGMADLWVVVAHWDLTEVERAALATRL